MAQTIAEFMTSHLVTVSPETPVQLAEHVAEIHGIRHLAVVARGDLVGVLCLCDLESSPPEAPVRTCMAAPVLTVAGDTPPQRAAEIMRSRRVGCLPVVEDGRLVGMLTRSDLRGHLPLHELRCSGCGTRRHVRALVDAEFAFCLDCLDAADRHELGGGD